MNDHRPELATDILKGANNIGLFLGFGPDPEKARRQIYNLVRTNKYFPWFKLSGGHICSRRSSLLAWLDGMMLNHTPSGKPLHGSNDNRPHSNINEPDSDPNG